MKDLTPKEAFDFIANNPNSVFVDCRTTAEYAYVGHPEGAQFIPWFESTGSPPNPQFVEQVGRLANKKSGVDTPLLFICRSGQRSQLAGMAMEKSGYKNVFNIVHGFEGSLDADQHRGNVNGWKADGLPWEQD